MLQIYNLILYYMNVLQKTLRLLFNKKRIKKSKLKSMIKTRKINKKKIKGGQCNKKK